MFARVSMLFFTLIASASAFAPSMSKVRATSALKMSFENELGGLPPVGYWDPLG